MRPRRRPVLLPRRDRGARSHRQLANDARDEDLDGPVGFDTQAQRKREFAADLGLQAHALRMAAEGAVAAYEQVIGEAWKPFERQVEHAGETVTKKVAAAQMSAFPWVKPWNTANAAGRITPPLRHNGMPYQGINVVLLWSEAVARGFTSPTCMTFKQSLELGGHIRKGESGTMVVYANKITKTETDDAGDDIERTVPFLRAYTVFCVDQIDGLPDHYYGRRAPSTPPAQRIASHMWTRSSPTSARPSGTAATRHSSLHPSTSSKCRRSRASASQELSGHARA